MPAAKDDDHLGLSLSLSCSKTVNNFREIPTSNKDNNPTGMNHFFQMASPSVPPPHQVPLQLNLMMMPSSSSSSSAVSNSSRFLTRNQLGAASLFQKSSTSMWNNSTTNLVHPYTSTDRASDSSPGVATATTTDSKFTGSADPRSFLKGIDVNRLPSSNNVADEDDVGVSSPNSTLSSVSGKRSERETAAHNTNNFPTGSGDDERTYSRGGGCGGSDDEDGEAARKKLRLSKDQSAVLEESFKEHNTLNPKQKQALAKRLGLRPRQVEVWFQNRRARTKLKQTEVDCEFLKRCCEQLTEENRRLQKEVQELRTLKLSPQFYMQMTPPTTLTMCPSCERVGSGGAGGGVHTPARPMLVPSNNNSTEAPSSAKHHRSGRVAASGGMTMNPWSLTAPSVPIRSYDALQPRS